MKALKFIGIIVLVLVLGVAGFIMSLKGEGRLERSIVINAPSEKIFTVVNDLSSATEWSPWFQIDPDTKYVFSANTVGVGANYTWESDHPDVMTGKQEILESRAPDYVNTQMWFGEMTGVFTAAFILKPVNDGTEVTWTYEGKSEAIMEKFFSDYLMEPILGPKYEEGLVNLKTYVEGLADPEPEIMQPDSTALEVEEIM